MNHFFDVRKIKNTLGFTLSSFFCLTTFVFCQNTPTGQFYLLERSVRQEAMGGAFAALSDDQEGIFGNPAGLALRSGGFSSYFLMPANDGDISFNSFGLNLWEYGRATTAISASYASVGMPSYDVVGRSIGNASETDFSARFAHSWWSDSGSLGLASKYLRNTLSAKHQEIVIRNFALDVGGMWNVGDKTSRFGFAIQNLSLSKSDDQFDLPAVYSAGMSWGLMGGILAADYHWQKNQPSSIHVGMEWRILSFALRGGYLSWVDSSTKRVFEPSAGVGIALSNFTFDAAYSGFGGSSFNPITRMSISWSIGPRGLNGSIKRTQTPHNRKSRIIVANFNSNVISKDDALQVRNAFETNLIKSDMFTLLARAPNILSTIKSEIDFQKSDMVDKKTVVRAGKRLGAEMAFTGLIYKPQNTYELVVELTEIYTSEIIGVYKVNGLTLTELYDATKYIVDAFSSVGINEHK